MLELMYGCGLRVSELVNLEINDIDMTNCLIRILGKGSKERIVVFGNNTKEVLLLYLNNGRYKLCKGNNDYLFLNKDGNKLSDRYVRKIIDDIIFKAGSSISCIIGTNLFFGIVDEMNAKPANVAAENLIENRMRLYQEMRDRRESSFSKAPKRTGMLMFTSSPTDEGDVLSEIISDTQKNGIPGVLIRDNIPRWEAREEDMDETFDFFLGSDTKDPCILDETIELKPEELDRVIKVPAKADYYSQFSSDPYLAIQNIAGRRTMPEMALFNTVASFERVFYKENYII